MKNLLKISILFVLIIALCSGMVHATTASELSEQLYALGSKYGATAGDKVKLDRYLTDYPVTDEQANAVMAKANEAAAVMDKAGVTSVKNLTADQKNQLKTIANEAASIVGLTLTFEGEKVNIYKNGKLIDSVSLSGSSASTSTNKSSNSGKTSSTASKAASGSKLVYTGNEYTVYMIGAVAVIALAGIVIIRKKVVGG